MRNSWALCLQANDLLSSHLVYSPSPEQTVYIEIKYIDSGVTLSGLTHQSYLSITFSMILEINSVNLSFLICKMGKAIVMTIKENCEEYNLCLIEGSLAIDSYCGKLSSSL